MVNCEKLMAGGVAGTLAIILLLQDNKDAAIAIGSAMLGFFIGDQNGEKTAIKALTKALSEKTIQHDKEVHNIDT